MMDNKNNTFMHYYNDSVPDGHPGDGHLLLRDVRAGDGCPGDPGQRGVRHSRHRRPHRQDRRFPRGAAAEGLHLQVNSTAPGTVSPPLNH